MALNNIIIKKPKEEMPLAMYFLGYTQITHEKMG
jgi:hypothetical protein